MAKVILRADGNSLIGLGHIYRLIALADLLKEEHTIFFLCSDPSERVRQIISGYVNELIVLPYWTYQLPDSKSHLEEKPFDFGDYLDGDEIVVIDGYWFGTRFQKSIKDIGAKLICIDDLSRGYFYADAVINHSPGIDVTQYKGEPYVKYYLGLDYALLRRNFFEPFPRPRHRKPKTLFISMGGSDQFGITSRMLEAAILSGCFTNIDLLVSSSFSEDALGQLVDMAQQASSEICIHKDLTAAALVELMDCTYTAIVPASTILLECYSRGMTCLAGYYAANQEKFYNGFVKERKSFALGYLKEFDIDSMAQRIRDLCANRGLEILNQPLKSNFNLSNIFEELN